MCDMTTETSRTLRLRQLLGESQMRFAERLGVSQPTIFRLESGRAETGSQRLLLDRLEEDIAAGRIASPHDQNHQPDRQEA